MNAIQFYFHMYMYGWILYSNHLTHLSIHTHTRAPHTIYIHKYKYIFIIFINSICVYATEDAVALRDRNRIFIRIYRIPFS